MFPIPSALAAGYLIDALLSANPLKEPETMVYGLGVVKLLASSPALRDQMVDTEVMALISSTLTVCCETCLGSQPTALEMTHMRNILIQVLSGRGNILVKGTIW